MADNVLGVVFWVEDNVIGVVLVEWQPVLYVLCGEIYNKRL